MDKNKFSKSSIKIIDTAVSYVISNIIISKEKGYNFCTVDLENMITFNNSPLDDPLSDIGKEILNEIDYILTKFDNDYKYTYKIYHIESAEPIGFEIDKTTGDKSIIYLDSPKMCYNKKYYNFIWEKKS